MKGLKGAHYRSEFLYNLLDILKLGNGRRLRYRIASKHVAPASSVIDVCSGTGGIRDFIPQGCAYTAIDASPEFLSELQKKGELTIAWNLHTGWPPSVPGVDVIVMVIALSQFRGSSAGSLLESFKKAAKRVVIVEEVLPCARRKGSLIQRLMNYLCGTDYYVPVTSWYTRQEFKQLMREHGYQCEEASGRYCVGLYGFQNKIVA